LRNCTQDYINKMEEQTPEIPTRPQEPVQQVPVEPKKKLSLSTIVILLVAIVLIGVGGIYAFKRFNQPKVCTEEAKVCSDGSNVGRTGPNCEFAPCPTEISSATPTSAETANWKTYTNIAGYSIKYPASFTTQLLAAGAGNKEADPTTRSLFIYKLDASEPYIERYINLEIFQVKPTYNQQMITQTTLDNRAVEKIVIPDAKFDIYSVQLGNKGFIEISVSNDLTKKEIADQILSTFKFLD